MVEVQRLDAALSIWSRYDAAVKADLFSTAIAVGSKTFLIDPIALGDEELPIGPPVTGIVITNANHLRASVDFSAKFSAPIYAMRHANAPGAHELRDGDVLANEVQIIATEGAAPGEIALFLPRDQGLLIVGDALINFGSNGFTFLPAKYCSDSKRMRKSLSKLLALNFERMLFAHGTPIMSKARDRLATLIAGSR
ncbi:MAG: hypothetical protein M3119_07800 [Verrucomicrobiota bacterium]|nr:hypothetical protein [Verrucomicrobiota bacterium]